MQIVLLKMASLEPNLGKLVVNVLLEEKNSFSNKATFLSRGQSLLLQRVDFEVKEGDSSVTIYNYRLKANISEPLLSCNKRPKDTEMVEVDLLLLHGNKHY